MSYFGDLLDDAEKRMGDGEFEFHDDDKLFKPPNVKLVAAKIKSAPGKGLSIAQGADFTSKGNNVFGQKHKTEVKYKCCDDHETKLTLTSADAELEYTYSPVDFNKDSNDMSVQYAHKQKPANGEFENKIELKVGGYELGPVKGWSEFQVDCNKDFDKKANKLSISNSGTFS